MQFKNLIQASLMGFVLSAPMASSAFAQNAVLSVSRGAVSSRISVAINRAIVVESDRPFAELSVANPEIADIASLSDRSIYVLGKTAGATTLTIFDQDGQLVANVDVRVSPDVAEFKERLSQILPGERIDVRTANEGIVLSGRVSGARTVARALELAELYAPGKITNMMVVGGSQQVMLQVRFAEMQRSVAKSLGSSMSAGVGAAAGFSALSSNGNRTLSNGQGLSSSPGSTGAISVGFGIGGLAVNVLIEALESKGMARTLAEPNLVAISGQRASFLAGGEYPVPTQSDSDSGTSTVTVEYRPFGVELNFLPTVIDGDLISLELETTVSSIDKDTSFTSSSGLKIAAFKVRRAATTVEMRDGQSFAIAGLLQDDFTDLNGQVPWLGDVPILGALFRSAEFQRKQTELVIIVTPHLVTPTTSDALALPTDRMRIPTEAELFLSGRTEGAARGAGSISQLGFDGSAGYVME